MTEGTPKAGRCKWIDRDEEGRPRCLHGWAIKSGSSWYCCMKARATHSRYQKTEKGRETQRRYAQSEKGVTSQRARQARYGQSERGQAVMARYRSEHAEEIASRNALYELCRVRVRWS